MLRLPALLLIAACAFAQPDWPSFGNDPGAMRYSTLRQIRVDNVARLRPAWTFRTGKPGSEAIPIVVGGVMYATAPDGVYALVPETGELLWKFPAAPVALRGLAYWKGTGGLPSRIFVGNGPYLLALDALTGKPAPGFGNEGRVDLKKDMLGDLPDGRYALQSPPAIFGGVVITGSSNGEGSPTAGAYGDDHAAEDGGRGLQRVAAVRQIAEHVFLQIHAALVAEARRGLAGQGVERQQVGAVADENPRGQPAGSFPIREAAEGDRRGGEFPEQLAGFRHERIHAVRRGGIHHAADDDRDGLRSRLAGAKGPCRPQARDVIDADLPQGGVPHGSGIVAEGRPIRLGEGAGGNQQEGGKPEHPSNLVNSGQNRARDYLASFSCWSITGRIAAKSRDPLYFRPLMNTVGVPSTPARSPSSRSRATACLTSAESRSASKRGISRPPVRARFRIVERDSSRRCAKRASCIIQNLPCRWAARAAAAASAACECMSSGNCLKMSLILPG